MNQSRPWTGAERRIALSSFIVAPALVILLLVRDETSLVTSAHRELLGHAGLSAALTAAGTGLYLVLRERRPSLLVLLVLGAAASVAAELVQGFAPRRTIQLRDIASGLSGVLIAGLLIELTLSRVSLLRSLRIYVAIATVVSLVLLPIILIDSTPHTVEVAPPENVLTIPDGETCALTSLSGNGERLVIGALPSIRSRCLTTAAGGFGLSGPSNVDELTGESVLLSSALGDLAQTVSESHTLTIRSEFIAASIEGVAVDGVAIDTRPGIIALLGSPEAGQVLNIRTHDKRLEVFGPTTGDTWRGVALSPTLTPGARHVIEVTLSGDAMTVDLDGRQVSSLVIGDGWTTALADPATQEDLTLYIGNSPARTLPFKGVIEWIEVES